MCVETRIVYQMCFCPECCATQWVMLWCGLNAVSYDCWLCDTPWVIWFDDEYFAKDVTNG